MTIIHSIENKAQIKKQTQNGFGIGKGKLGSIYTFFFIIKF